MNDVRCSYFLDNLQIFESKNGDRLFKADRVIYSNTVFAYWHTVNNI